MPKGRRGQKRPEAVTGNAVRVMCIATDEADDSAAAEMGRKGGRARAAKMTATAEAARNAAPKRL